MLCFLQSGENRGRCRSCAVGKCITAGLGLAASVVCEQVGRGGRRVTWKVFRDVVEVNQD